MSQDHFNEHIEKSQTSSYTGTVEVHSDRAVTAFNGKIILLCRKCLNAHVYMNEKEASCKSCGAKRPALSGFILNLEDPDPSRGVWYRPNTGDNQYPVMSIEKN